MAEKNCKKCFLQILIAFIVIYAFDFVWHGMLLKDLYQETAELWRSKEAMSEFFPFILINYALFAIIFVCFFNCFIIGEGKKSSLKDALKGGFFIGALFGVMSFSFYAYMPMPLILAIAWLIGNILSIMILSYILYLLKNK